MDEQATQNGRVRADAVVSALYEAYNAHDTAAVAALYAPTGRHVDAASGNERSGGGAIAKGLSTMLTAFPDAHWYELKRVCNGDRAAITYILTGTLSSPFGPFEPAGQRLELRGVHVIDIGPDGIELSEDYWDSATFGRQMKAIPHVAPNAAAAAGPAAGGGRP